MTNRPVILICDNDDGMVKALVARLSRLGFECLSAVTGAQSLAIFRENAVDLIITDLNMPGGDGVALITSVREVSNVPVIVITGFSDAFRGTLHLIPNVTVVEKPFRITDLIDLIDVNLLMKDGDQADFARVDDNEI